MLLTLSQVASALNRSPRTVARLLDRGELPYIQVLRARLVHPDDLAAYIARQMGRRINLAPQGDK